MRINDFVMFLPNIAISILKVVRTNIDEFGKQEILHNGLYHITKDEDTAKKIIESEHLRPAIGIGKNITSYGRASVFLFNGTPSIENYIKNLGDVGNKNNPYLNPTMVANAIKISPTEVSELANYKARGLVDNAIIYEGYCILPKNKTEVVKLVPDLVRQKDTESPLINVETGKYCIAFREATLEELENDGKTYKAKEDYLQFIEEERKELGYLKRNRGMSSIINGFLSIIYDGKIEGSMTIDKIKNIPKNIKKRIMQFTIPKLDMSTDERINSIANEFNSQKKNPYRDKKFGQAVAKFQTQGLEQLNLRQELESITTSDIGAYFRNKYNQIDKNLIIKNGIHGITHNNRVAIHSMIIAKNEGILEEDENDRTKDILLSAAYYHDIGREKGIITDNHGPHSKNSSRKINKMNLTYANGEAYSLEDKRILQAVVEAHEGKDKNMDKVCKKYKISEENIEYTKRLMTVLKDADALDRVRLDLNLPIAMKTELNPKYLRTNTSKQLLNASYQLETLSKKISFDRILAYKTNEQTAMKKTKREEFLDSLSVGISKTPETIKSIKKKLKLTKIQGQIKGKNIMNKIKSLVNSKQNREHGAELSEEGRE